MAKTKQSYKIAFVPHKIIGNHLACYNVKYKGKIIRPRAAIKLKIPLNEIWISKKLKGKKKAVLYHELQEIKYRCMGYSGKKAHEKAKRDEKS